MRKQKIANLSKKWMLLVSLAMLCMFTTGNTLTYMVTNTEALENKFLPGGVPVSVQEAEFDGSAKENVTIRNEGNVDAYIRAYLVITWQNDQGDVFAANPVEGVDYALVLPENSDWVKAKAAGAEEAYYYYTERVCPEAETGLLLAECKPLKAAPAEGYALSVEVIAQSVQADGIGTPGQKAVVLAWNIDPEALKEGGAE